MRTAGFTTLVTVDRNLTYQQNIAAAGVSGIVMHARTHRVPELLPLAPQGLAAIAAAAPGEIAHVGV